MIIKILIFIIIFFVVVVDATVLYAGTKPTLFYLVYNLYYFLITIISVFFLKQSLFFKRSVFYILVVGVIIGFSSSVLANIMLSFSMPRWRHNYIDGLFSFNVMSSLIDTFIFFWGWLITPLILLWIKFVFISSPDSTSSKKER